MVERRITNKNKNDNDIIDMIIVFFLSSKTQLERAIGTLMNWCDHYLGNEIFQTPFDLLGSSYLGMNTEQLLFLKIFLSSVLITSN